MNKKLFLGGLFVAGLLMLSPVRVSAQMMGYPSSSPGVSSSDIAAEEQDQQAGKDLMDKLSNNQITCVQLTDDDFDKIGDYFMGQSIGDTAKHAQVDNAMKQMMGDQGETQMHIALGKQRSGCGTATTYPNMMMEGGGSFMMGWGGYGNMMYGGWGLYGALGFLLWLAALVDLVLLGIWLWKKIQRKS